MITEQSYNALAQKAVQYIEDTEPKLAKLAQAEESKSAFVKRATKAASVLVERGLLPKSNEGSFVDKVAEAPELVFDLVEKLAQDIGPATFGEASNEKIAVSTSDDPFEKVFFPAGGNTGTID
jgi:hypothetical protein